MDSMESTRKPDGARELGAAGPRVAPIGLGCMGMSWIYAESGRDDAESVRVIREALDSGVGLLDTAALYGDGHNERLDPVRTVGVDARPARRGGAR